MFPLCFVIYPIPNVLNSDCCITCKIAWLNKDIFIVFQETGFTKLIVVLATFTEGNNFNMHAGFYLGFIVLGRCPEWPISS